MAVTTPTPSPTVPGAPSAASGFRPDIDALRALAIVLVVLYHAHVPWLAGGFVGVDVFFVISGFLITRNLIAEHQRAGRVALRSFWLRRLRRLVPAMAVMVAATLVLSALVLTPLEWEAVTAQGLAATLYVSNLHFAGMADDYFATGVEAAPLLHTWSLSVEEQFYVVWPVLLGAVLTAAHRARRAGGAVVAALGAITVGSFGLSVHLVSTGSAHAFYGLPARTWEFSLAGLLAVVAVRRPGWRLDGNAAIVVASAGVATIGWAATSYGSDTAFPGVSALVPVGATLAIVAAGTWSTATWRAATPPLRWLGTISYSWYLWHWPAMVLVVAAADADTPTVRLLAGLGALGIAHLSLTRIEDPVRRSARLAASAPRTLAVTAAFTLLALAAVGGVALHHRRIGSSSFHTALASAADKAYLDACSWGEVDGTEVCTVGDPDGGRTVVLSGDSHAMSWVPGFDAAGEDLGVRVIVRAASSCPGAPVPTISERTGEVDEACAAYRDETLAMVDGLGPDAVVLVSSDFTRRTADASGHRLPTREAQLGAWAEALRRLDADLERRGIELGAVLDNPRITPDPLRCMAEERQLSACDADRSAALERVRRHVENERDVLGEVATFDTIDLVCDDDTCDIWRDDAYVYADETHLSDDFTATQADHVADYLEDLLGAE